MSHPYKNSGPQMQPSKITDDELRLAIIEKLYGPNRGYDDPTYPNYPGDIAAATGLLLGCNLTWSIFQDHVSIYVPWENTAKTFKAKHDETLEGIARAISISWLEWQVWLKGGGE